MIVLKFLFGKSLITYFYSCGYDRFSFTGSLCTLSSENCMILCKDTLLLSNLQIFVPIYISICLLSHFSLTFICFFARHSLILSNRKIV